MAAGLVTSFVSRSASVGLAEEELRAGTEGATRLLRGGWELRSHWRLHVFQKLSNLRRVQTGGWRSRIR